VADFISTHSIQDPWFGVSSDGVLDSIFPV
jgi:hypothetical protein